RLRRKVPSSLRRVVVLVMIRPPPGPSSRTGTTPATAQPGGTGTRITRLCPLVSGSTRLVDMSSMTQTGVAAPASAAPRIRSTAVLTVLLTAQLMAILAVNIVNVAAATIRADLHSGGAGLQLVIAGYMIAYAVLLITGARLGGLYGYRRMFLTGLATFTL